MTSQAESKVRGRYPHAVAERQEPELWVVLDISREEQKRRNEFSWPFQHTRGVFGLGRTEEEAWVNAVRNIEALEGRKLGE